MAMSPRLLRPRASGFNPKSVSGLQLWLDAADVSQMTQNSNGTTPATQTNDPVGYWADKSGNGRHARQTTNNNRPTLQLADRNGRAGLNFDGLNDFFLCDSGAQFAGAFCFAVLRRTGTPNAWATIYRHNDISNVAGVPAGPQSFSVQQTNVSTGFLFGLLGDGAIQRLNGNALTTVNSGQFNIRHAEMLPDTTSTNVIGVQGNINTTVGTQHPTIGLDAFSASRVYPMRLYELLIYSAIPSDAQLRVIERYLGGKWGIAIA